MLDVRANAAPSGASPAAPRLAAHGSHTRGAVDATAGTRSAQSTTRTCSSTTRAIGVTLTVGRVATLRRPT